MSAKYAPRRILRFDKRFFLSSNPRSSITYQTRTSRHDTRNISTSLTRPIATQYAHLNSRQTLISLSKTRTLFTSSLPPLLIPPTLFLALLLALWTWKCFWIVVMQDKLLYLSWLPPLSRSESIDDYRREFRGVLWTEKSIVSSDGTRLAVCEGRLPSFPAESSTGGGIVNGGSGSRKAKRRVVICYFQGNGGSTPMRLSLLSQTLKAVGEDGNATSHSGNSGNADEQVEYILVALSYRGYWKSKGRATQRGIELDAQAFLDWAYETYRQPNQDFRAILWGHSLGAAVASSAVVKRLSARSETENSQPAIAGLILEAPISSIKEMLISLYPQRWLPYRYLWPLSWNTWDIASSLEKIALYRKVDSAKPAEQKQHRIPPILLLSAESDEVIPLWVADQLEGKAREHGLDIQRTNVKGAMHIEAPLKPEGKKALVGFIVSSSGRCT